MNIKVLCHSSIKIEAEGKIIYVDPFRIKEENYDADIIAVTHSHYDHFSEEDILKLKNKDTKILVTHDLIEKVLKLGFEKEDIISVTPNNTYNVLGIEFKTIHAYNINKKFHPKENNWVGYILNLEDKKIYIAGDTDVTEENKKVDCNIALVPVGGTYTMTYSEAARLVNTIKPDIVIPIHYGEIVGEKKDGLEFKKLVDNSIEVDIQI